MHKDDVSFTALRILFMVNPIHVGQHEDGKLIVSLNKPAKTTCPILPFEFSMVNPIHVGQHEDGQLIVSLNKPAKTTCPILPFEFLW